jgi:hypothetical protein
MASESWSLGWRTPKDWTISSSSGQDEIQEPPRKKIIDDVCQSRFDEDDTVCKDGYIGLHDLKQTPYLTSTLWDNAKHSNPTALLSPVDVRKLKGLPFYNRFEGLVRGCKGRQLKVVLGNSLGSWLLFCNNIPTNTKETHVVFMVDDPDSDFYIVVIGINDSDVSDTDEADAITKLRFIKHYYCK